MIFFFVITHCWDRSSHCHLRYCDLSPLLSSSPSGFLSSRSSSSSPSSSRLIGADFWQLGHTNNVQCRWIYRKYNFFKKYRLTWVTLLSLCGRFEGLRWSWSWSCGLSLLWRLMPLVALGWHVDIHHIFIFIFTVVFFIVTEANCRWLTTRS